MAALPFDISTLILRKVLRTRHIEGQAATLNRERNTLFPGRPHPLFNNHGANRQVGYQSERMFYTVFEVNGRSSLCIHPTKHDTSPLPPASAFTRVRTSTRARVMSRSRGFVPIVSQVPITRRFRPRIKVSLGGTLYALPNKPHDGLGIQRIYIYIYM